MKKLSSVYPNEHIIKLRSKKRIKDSLLSKASSTWGNGPIPDTNYFQLERCSPNTKGEKPLVIVCTMSLYESVNNAIS